MPHKTLLQKREQRNKANYNATLCATCRQPLQDRPVIVLQCDHKEHTDCLKTRILQMLYDGFWDCWGVHDVHCNATQCNAVIRHLCGCHTSKDVCALCVGCPHQEVNVIETKHKNEQYTNNKITGFLYRGRELAGEGDVQFIPDIKSNLRK